MKIISNSSLPSEKMSTSKSSSLTEQPDAETSATVAILTDIFYIYHTNTVIKDTLDEDNSINDMSRNQSQTTYGSVNH